MIPLRFRFIRTLKYVSVMMVPTGVICGTAGIASLLQAQMRTVPVALPKKCSQVASIAVLPVKFDCYHLTAGGIREYNDKMSRTARKQVTRQVERILSKRGYHVQTFPDDQLHNTRWARLRHFYSVVSREIQRNVYSPARFPAADRTFAYSLPPLPDSLIDDSVDAVLFVDGFDDRSTERRKKRAIGAAIGSAITGVLFGVYMIMPEDRTFASCALVNKWGEVIWYHLYTKSGNIQMTDSNDAAGFLRNLFDRFGRREEQQ